MTVEQLRADLQTSETKRVELIELGQALEQQLKDCQAELTTKAQAELNALRFQLTQAKIETQVKEREIHRLRQAATSATEAGEPIQPTERSASSTYGSGFVRVAAAPQPAPPTSDSRVDQLIEVVQQLASRIEHPKGTDQGGQPSDNDELEELKGKHIVDNRALLHKLEPIPVGFGRMLSMSKLPSSTCLVKVLFTIGSPVHSETIKRLLRIQDCFPSIVLSQIPIGQRPDDRLTGEWLFHRVKHVRKLERVIEDIRESAKESKRREWE